MALSKGDLEKAEASLQKARFESPNDPQIRYNLGICLYRKHQYTEAAKHLEAALKLPDSLDRDDIFHNLGNALYFAGDFAKAAQAYRAALDIREEPKTRYNLEQAEKKLNEEIERQRKQDQQSDQKQNQRNSSQNQDQQQNQGQQQNSGQSGNQEQSSQEKQQNQGKEGQQNQSQGSPQDQQASRDNSASGTPDMKPANSSGSNELNESDQNERTDVAMKKPDEKAAPPPEKASERARGLKNIKLDKNQIQRILQQMEEREKEAQKYYRVEPNRQDSDDELDPFMMDARQLRDFFERRQGRRPPKAKTPDTPDW